MGSNTQILDWMEVSPFYFNNKLVTSQIVKPQSVISAYNLFEDKMKNIFVIQLHNRYLIYQFFRGKGTIILNVVSL